MMITGLHIEPTNICTLRCAGCARTDFIRQWPQHWKNASIAIDDLMRFLDIDLAGVRVRLCGTYGDPIYHPDFLRLVEAFKNRGAVLSIITNGSHRKEAWWQDLCVRLTDSDTVIFAIDGSPETFTQYRENGEWSSIQQAIAVCVQSPARIIWKFIPFRFNQHEIQSVKQLSETMGMDGFMVESSDRWDEHTRHLMPDSHMIGQRFGIKQTVSQGIPSTNLRPKCQSGMEHYVSAQGFYMPCCFMANHSFYYKTEWGKQRSSFAIAETTISRIMTRQATVDFYQNLPKDPPMVCQYHCSQD